METLQEHLRTVEFIKEIGFARVHVFPYSEREGTPAAMMKGAVAHSERKIRAAQITQVASNVAEQYVRSQIGKPHRILLERKVNDGLLEGYTEKYIKARCQGKVNEIVLASAKDIDGDILICDRKNTNG